MTALCMCMAGMVRVECAMWMGMVHVECAMWHGDGDDRPTPAAAYAHAQYMGMVPVGWA